MRVLVCGGRNFNDRHLMLSVMDKLRNTCRSYDGPNTLEIITGMASGADALAAEYARTFSLRLHEFPADWRAHGRGAGPIRNQQMLDEGKPDLVIAFPGGRGTADMVRRAHKAGVPVREIS